MAQQQQQSPHLALSDAHRSAQDQLAAALAALILASWAGNVAPGIPSNTVSDAWIAQMAPLILTFRQRSQDLAQSFYEAERTLAGISEPLAFAPADLIDLEVIQTSLKVTGIIGLSQKIASGMDPQVAFEQAGAAAGGAGIRHALNGGRSATRNTVAQDRTALGFFRQTRDDCCWFCAMLASRGVVFGKDSFDESDARFIGADSDAKVHDNCHCQMTPLWSNLDKLPDLNVQAEDLWYSATKGVSGSQNQRNAFRQAWEARAATLNAN